MAKAAAAKGTAAKKTAAKKGAVKKTSVKKASVKKAAKKAPAKAAAKKEKVGFIGVGLMGHGMAKNILEKGYKLSIMGHRNRKPVTDLVKRGAKEVKTPAAMARQSDVIFLCVTSSVQVEDLIRRKGGILAGAKRGLTIVDCSTSDPNSTLALAAELKAKGITLIDAPLGRSPREAEEGRLNAFVGADQKTYKRLLPLMQTWAENIIHVGPVGSGHKIKLINNFVAMSYAALYAEAFTACKMTGIDIQTFHDVIAAGGLYNGFFQNYCKWVLGRDPKAHEFTISNCAKDMRYYNNMADAVGLTTIIGAATKQSYVLAMTQGKGDDYMPMMADAIGGVNGVDFGKK